MDIAEATRKAKTYSLTPDNFKYILRMVPISAIAENKFLIQESYYFFPIQESKILENPNLEQNNNWGGKFNPTMEWTVLNDYVIKTRKYLRKLWDK